MIAATFSLTKLTPPSTMCLMVQEILTSNIQYLDYQINQVARPFYATNIQNIPIEHNRINMEEMDRIFCQYELFSRKKWLLLHVRSLLTTNNALLIFTMLSDGCLSTFDKEEIGIIINGQVGHS